MTMPHKISIPDFIQNMIEFVQAWPQIKQTACPVIEVTIEFIEQRKSKRWSIYVYSFDQFPRGES